MPRTHHVKSYRGRKTCQHEHLTGYRLDFGWNDSRNTTIPVAAVVHVDTDVDAISYRLDPAAVGLTVYGLDTDLGDGPVVSDAPEVRPVVSAVTEVCGKTRAEHKAGAHVTDAMPDHDYDGGTLRCGACHEPIRVGDAYKFVKPRTHRGSTGRKLNRHESCPGWKASELTSSQFRSIQYAADEQAPDLDTDSWEAAQASVEAYRDHFATAAREMAEIRQEAAENIEDGFGHETYQSEELRGEGDEAEQVADALEMVDVEPEHSDDEADDYEAWEESEPTEPEAVDFETDADYQAALADWEDGHARWEAEEPDEPGGDIEAWVDEKRDEIDSEWGNLP